MLPRISRYKVGFRYILDGLRGSIALRCLCVVGVPFLNPLYPTYMTLGESCQSLNLVNPDSDNEHFIFPLN